MAEMIGFGALKHVLSQTRTRWLFVGILSFPKSGWLFVSPLEWWEPPNRCGVGVGVVESRWGLFYLPPQKIGKMKAGRKGAVKTEIRFSPPPPPRPQPLELPIRTQRWGLCERQSDEPELPGATARGASRSPGSRGLPGPVLRRLLIGI